MCKSDNAEAYFDAVTIADSYGEFTRLMQMTTMRTSDSAVADAYMGPTASLVGNSGYCMALANYNPADTTDNSNVWTLQGYHVTDQTYTVDCEAASTW